MEPLTVIQDFAKLRDELLQELHRAAGSFCRIGYLLKQARDTDILKETSYTDVYDFAKSEFGLEKTQVSRFININNRFSINGNSEQLLPEYAEYGVAKLSLMLTLPDEINEELTPDYSKSDIQAIKTEYDAEQKITPLELMTEPKAEQPETDNDEFLAMVVKQLNDEHPTPIGLIHEIRKDTLVTSDEVKDAYRPGEDKTYIIRISGVGRYNVYAKDKGITIQNIREMTRTSVDWEEWMDLVLEDEETRKFTEVVKASPKNEKKPAKVEKSSVQKKAESVAKSEKAEEKQPENNENGTKNDENAQNPTENVQKLTEEIEKVEGEVVEDDFINPPKSTVTDISQISPRDEKIAGDTETNQAAGEDNNSNNKAAGDSDDVEDTAAGESDDVEDTAAGDEDVMIDKLEMLVSPTEIYKIREMVREMDSIHGYRESLDRICGWIADLHTITNNLYAKLASRGK